MRKIAVGDLGEFWYGDYKEPFVQLEGGVPGYPQGVLLKDDVGGLLCAFCGKTYTNLAGHSHNTHKMTAREYKDATGLLQKSALVSDTVRLSRSRNALRTGFGTRREAIQPNPKGSHGVPTGKHKAEFLNKTGTCYAQMIEAGKSLIRETGRLSERELRKRGIYEGTVARYFGDMDGYRKAVGATPLNIHRAMTNAQLLDVIRNLAMSLGRTPAMTDLRRYGLPRQQTYVRRFGSWTEAVRRAGLEPNVPIPDSDDLTAQMFVTYATLGSITATARHLHIARSRVEEEFARYGAPFIEYIGHGVDASARRAWAADMARRLAGTEAVA